MAKIHGFVYIVVGVFVSIASYKINYEKLYVFFYAGLFFTAFGVAKLLIKFMTRKESKAEAIQKPFQQIRQKQAQRPSQQFKRCRNCGNVMKLYDNFCSRCGARA